MKIDLHTHILPERWPDLAQRYGYGGFVHLEHHQPCRARMMIGDKFFREIEDNCWSPARRLEDCARSGVDVQVLSTVPVMFNYWAKAEHTHDLAMLLNDHIAGVVAADPTRFIGLGTIPMQDTDRAVRELERCVRELRMPGVQIGTNVNGLNLNEPALQPIFAAAEQLGAAIFVHPWEMLGKERMPKYWLPWLVGMPAETALAICSMIFGGVFERFPRLRVCFAHGGGAMPYTIGRIQHGFEARPDLCAVDCNVAPRSYLADAASGRSARFYVDSLVHDPEALRLLIKMMGCNRIALGTDYPFPLGEDQPGRLIESLTELSTEQRNLLLAGSALEFLQPNAATLKR
ncbi:MAG: amidohydrolase family protein [Phycisphaerae bacterium]